MRMSGHQSRKSNWDLPNTETCSCLPDSDLSETSGYGKGNDPTRPYSVRVYSIISLVTLFVTCGPRSSHSTVLAEDSGLLGCWAVSIYRLLPTFLRHCDLSKCRWIFTKLHGVRSQKAEIFSFPPFTYFMTSRKVEVKVKQPHYRPW
jgi:hypothetical protein